MSRAKFPVAIVLASDDLSGIELLGTCRPALAELAEVDIISIDDADALADRSLALILMSIDVERATGLEPFVRCQRLNPIVPIILLARGANAMTAVELVKCGAEDFCEVPIDGVVLRRKVARALDLFHGAAMTIPLLEPLIKPVDAHAASSRRVYRAPCAGVNVATVQVRAKRGIVTLPVGQVSVPIDRHKGGLGILVGKDLIQELPLDEWRERGSFKMRLTLSTEPGPIDLSVQMVGDLRSGSRNRLLLGVQYQPEVPTDVAKIKNFWLECQRAPLGRPVRQEGGKTV